MNSNKLYCVYQIYNKVEDKSYIGSTCNFERRIFDHKKYYYNDWHIDFHQHPEHYEVNILEDDITDDQIYDKEMYYIDLYDAIDNGYNKKRQGNTHNLSSRNKLSKSLKGNIPWNKGKTGIYSEETLQKMRKPKTEEQKRKLSEVVKGKYAGEKNPMYGKNSEDYMTPEAIKLKRQRMSEKRKGRKFYNNGKEQIFCKPEEKPDGYILGKLKK